MAEWLFGAVALVFVIDGLLPFLSPELWRQLFESAMRLSNGQIRFLGLSSILVGVALLTLIRG